MTLYQVTVSTETKRVDPDGTIWRGVNHAPTFYLDSNVQGIVDDIHAERIVRQWFTDLGLPIASIVVLAEGDYYHA